MNNNNSSTKQYQSGTDSDSVVSEVTSTASSSLHVKSTLTECNDKTSMKRTTPLKIGDRVIVNASSGTKLGTLMFLGKFLGNV